MKTGLHQDNDFQLLCTPINEQGKSLSLALLLNISTFCRNEIMF